MTRLSYAPPVADGTFNIRKFGAACNDSTDDAAAIQAAVNAAAATGVGGTVLIPGRCAVGSTITFPPTTGSNIRLAGVGREASRLRKTFNGLLLDISGTATGFPNHLYRNSIQSLTLDGNAGTGTLLRTYYVDNFYVDDVRFANIVGRGVDALEMFDSYFRGSVCESVCGNSGNEPAIHLRCSIAASGFGFSSDNCNMVWFDNVRIEDFVDGGIWVERGGFGSANCNGIYFTNIKFETHRVRGPAFRWDDSCKHMHASHVEIYMGAFMTGISTPTDAIQDYVPDGSSIRDLRLTFAETAGVIQNGISTYCAVGPMVIDHVKHAGLAPLTALINNFGGPGKVMLGPITVEPASGTVVQAGVLKPVENPYRVVNYGANGPLTVRTGTNPTYNDTGSSWSFVAARADVRGAAPTGAAVIVAVLVDGVSQFTITVPAGSTSSGLVAAPAGTVPAGSSITLNITQVGSTTPGTDLAVTLTMQSIT